MLFVAAAVFGMILLAPEEVSVQVNEDINAPIEEVFDAVTNPNKLVNWVNGVASVRQIIGDGPGVDAEYKLSFEGEGQMTMTQKVDLFEENNEYAYTGTVQDFMEVNSRTTFEALDSNKTRISVYLTMRPLSYKMKMFIYAEETHKANAAMNNTRLKEYLEKK